MVFFTTLSLLRLCLKPLFVTLNMVQGLVTIPPITTQPPEGEGGELRIIYTHEGKEAPPAFASNSLTLASS